jgi:hypothetical protein
MGIELSGSIKHRKFVEVQKNHELLKMDSAP